MSIAERHKVNEEGFKEFFEKELKPELRKLEIERQVIQKQHQAIAIGSGTVFIIGVVCFILGYSIVGVLFFGLAAALLFLFKSKDSWNEKYKQNVITRMLEFIDPVLVYQPTKGIGRPLFDATLLHYRHYDKYHTEDQVSGKFGNINFRYCEAKAETTGNEGKVHFSGVFMECDFNKNFKNHYILIHDVADKGLLGKIASRFDKFDRIPLEDPRFEKVFDLRGPDQVEGRYIFSPAFMERLLELDQIFDGKSFQMAFFDGKLYFTYEYDRDQFDHDFRLKADHYMHLFKSYWFACQMIAIIDILDLNNDIWKPAN